MANFRLIENQYISPTPAGAYYAVSTPQKDESRSLISHLLQQESNPLLTMQNLVTWSNAADEDSARELLYHIQELGWVQGSDSPETAPAGALEETLPQLLGPLSGDGKALLADSQGFYLASRGFPHETAEELSALSADLASLYTRHQGVLDGNLGLGSSAWAIVDAAGNSQIGFWPLYIGEQCFVLAMAGLPHLNQPELTRLIWALNKRYGTSTA